MSRHLGRIGVSHSRELPEAANLDSSDREVAALRNHVLACQPGPGGVLRIVEAGCGRRWPVELGETRYTLTGVDMDSTALDLRKTIRKDLDTAIVGDLRTVSLPTASYDLVFSRNVLEHIPGAEKALMNFATWLRPGGHMILIFPNRDSAYSFAARMTPFRLHVWYKKYIQQVTNAGEPGFDPYPVEFDKVVSRHGMHEFCRRHGLVIRAEYRIDRCQMKNRSVWFLIEVFMRVISVLSLGRLSADYRNLLFVVQKPWAKLS